MKILTILIGLTFAMIPLSLKAGLISQPVAYWNFDSDFKATMGGSVYDATAYNGASINTTGGKFGGAASFTKASSQYLQTASSPFTTGSYTYSAWYYLDVDDITGTNRYFVLESTNAANGVWPASYGLKDNGTTSPQGDVGNVYTYTTASTSSNFSFSDTLHKTWHNVIVTYDGSKTTAYLDGSLAGSMTTTGTLAPTTKLVMGGHRAGTGRNWNGLIDEVAVWDHVLTSNEISSLQTSPVPEPGSLLLLASGILGVLVWGEKFFLARHSRNITK